MKIVTKMTIDESGQIKRESFLTPQNGPPFSIPHTKYRFKTASPTPQRGDPISQIGYVKNGTVVHSDEETLVIAWKGYSENPGSRYSGLKIYYPATTEVFIKATPGKDLSTARYYSLTEWTTRPTKK